MKRNSIHSSIANLLIVVMIVTACKASGGGGGGTDTTPSAVVTYGLPFLPIEIAYDFISGKIRVAISNKIQTPLGTFGFSGGVVLEERKYRAAERRHADVRKLRIEAGDKLYVYGLDDGEQYSIKIPSDVYGNTTIETTGPDGDITVIIPHPTSETIYDLQEKIRVLEEQARARAAETTQPPAEVQGGGVPSGDDSAPQEEEAAATEVPPSSASESGPPPPTTTTAPRRTLSGIYKGSAGVADIRESDGDEFSFVLSTPYCTREAIGRARWTSEGVAESVSPIREDAAGVGPTTPVESACSLLFTFSPGGLTVAKVGENCHCNYAGLYPSN